MVLVVKKSVIDYLEYINDFAEKAIFSDTTTKIISVISVPYFIALYIFLYWCLKYLFEIHPTILELYLPLSLILLLLTIVRRINKAAFSCDLRFFMSDLVSELSIVGLAFFVVTVIINYPISLF